MSLKLILSGGMGKWAYTLVEYDLAYEPLRSMKGQVVAGFIGDHAIEVEDREFTFMVRFVVEDREPGV
jgi:hypothetical protein